MRASYLSKARSGLSTELVIIVPRIIGPMKVTHHIPAPKHRYNSEFPSRVGRNTYSIIRTHRYTGVTWSFVTVAYLRTKLMDCCLALQLFSVLSGGRTSEAPPDLASFMNVSFHITTTFITPLYVVCR